MNKRYALLICNGEQPFDKTVRELAKSAAYVVCADGGANVARKLGILPNLIIGDFDSITMETQQYFKTKEVDFRHVERQDNTDFEKALNHLYEIGCFTVAIVGVTGGLLDHTFGNFSILLRHSKCCRFVLFDPHYRIDIITQTTHFTASPGDRISIVPLTICNGVRYEGLRYQLAGGVLRAGLNEGTCNETLGEQFTVYFDEGVLLVFRQYHKFLLKL